MSSKSTFDILVTRISPEERNTLLEKIRTAMSDLGSFFEVPPQEKKRKSQIKVHELGFFARIWLIIRSFFTGKSQESIFEEDRLCFIARILEFEYQDLLDYGKKIVLSRFETELEGLRNSARYFYDILHRSVEKDRYAFYAFLASIVMPSIHTQLIQETNPSTVLDKNEDDKKARSILFDVYDRIMMSIPEQKRKAMYEDIRSLLFLKRLSSFNFEKALAIFKSEEGNPKSAVFSDAKKLFVELGDILFSMAEPPSAECMQAIYIYIKNEELEGKEMDMASLIEIDTRKTSNALETIRNFHRRIPLVDLLKLIIGNADYKPKQLPAGEDWFALYKLFWRRRIENSIGDWKTERKLELLREEVKSFMGMTELKGLANIQQQETDLGPGVRLASSLQFLYGFARTIFSASLSKILKTILKHGSFLRKDRSNDFNSACSYLFKLQHKLEELDLRLTSGGDLFDGWVDALNESSGVEIKRRKLQAMYIHIDSEAEGIVKNSSNSLVIIISLFKNIVQNFSGDTFEIWINLSSIESKNRKEFIKALQSSISDCEKINRYLAELSVIPPPIS